MLSLCCWVGQVGEWWGWVCKVIFELNPTSVKVELFFWQFCISNDILGTWYNTTFVSCNPYMIFMSTVNVRTSFIQEIAKSKEGESPCTLVLAMTEDLVIIDPFCTSFCFLSYLNSVTISHILLIGYAGLGPGQSRSLKWVCTPSTTNFWLRDVNIPGLWLVERGIMWLLKFITVQLLTGQKFSNITDILSATICWR